MKRIFFLILALFIPLLNASTPFSEANKARILVGSPIRQKPEILNEFLTSLEELNQDIYTFDYMFIDDNVDPKSSELLQAFKERHPGQCVVGTPDNLDPEAKYVCNEFTHHWSEEVVWKVAAFKDAIIEIANHNGYDHLFFIDSDLVLNPQTVSQLVKADKDILSNIFWTKWTPQSPLLPQVWLYDSYTQYEIGINEKITQNEMFQRHTTFVNQLKQPGVYKVGGLGACTLISKRALAKGVSFKKIKNITFWGEDRHFCVRAAALGIEMHVDTHYPAYHIYRQSDLAGVENFKKGYQTNHIANSPKITLSMCVRNEEGRYLEKMLAHAKRYITNAVIIDDASTDRTVEICKKALAGIPLTLIQNDECLFMKDEKQLRQLQWDTTIATNPDWILNLDADEIFEEKAIEAIPYLVKNEDADAFCFPLFDFWDENHYREDDYWSAHKYYRPMLMKYDSNNHYSFADKPIHTGRFPQANKQLVAKSANVRIKHYGWAKESDRQKKYARYKQVDPDAKYGWKEQYESILDTHPRLIAWVE